jgi:threonine aldolase
MSLDFRSDTVTRPTPAMRAAIAAAEVGDDVYGDDPTVNALESRAARMLGFEAALFATSGTQTNLLGLLVNCERGDEAIVGQNWHTYKWEGGGMAVLGSIQPQPLEHAPDGTIPIATIEAAIKPDDSHFARTRLIVMENTTGGRVLPLDYLGEVRALARRRGLNTHLDGARLFNAAAAIAQHRAESGPQAPSGARTEGAPRTTTATATASEIQDAAREICSHFDTVSVCLSKGLGAPVGSLLLGSGAAVAKARRWRKMLGGGMRQAGIIAAGGLHALEHHVGRLLEDHAHAVRLAEGMNAIGQAFANDRGPALRAEPPQTNIVFLHIRDDLAERFPAHLNARGLQVNGSAGRYGSGLVQRWVTHLDVHEADVALALAHIRRFFPD